MDKMKYRRAVFAVVYSRSKNKIEYLILKRKLHWKGWEFPKGGIKIFETQKMAVRREIKEETGLEIRKIKKFKMFGRYEYDKVYLDRKGFSGQTFSLYAVEVKRGKVKMSELEHSDYKWAEFKEAKKKLKWPNQKRCLEIVDEFLKHLKN